MVTTTAITERVIVAVMSNVFSHAECQGEERCANIPKERYLHIGQLVFAKGSYNAADDCRGRQGIQISGETFFLFLIEHHFVEHVTADTGSDGEPAKESARRTLGAGVRPTAVAVVDMFVRAAILHARAHAAERR